MSTATLAGKISNKVISNMYKSKGSMNENGEKIYRKSSFIFICGIALLVIFVPCLFCINYFVNELIAEESIEESMRIASILLGYMIDIFMNFLGIFLIVTYKKFKFILSTDKIVCCKIFSKKCIELYSLEKIRYSNFNGLVFKNNKTKIKFGIYTNGLIEVLNFIEENIPEYKYQDSLKKARKMLKNNRIKGEGIENV